MPVLDDAVLVGAVHALELAEDVGPDDGRLFLGDGVAPRLAARDLDARPVHQEGVVQNHKVVVEHAQRVALQHTQTHTKNTTLQS